MTAAGLYDAHPAEYSSTRYEARQSTRAVNSSIRPALGVGLTEDHKRNRKFFLLDLCARKTSFEKWKRVGLFLHTDECNWYNNWYNEFYSRSDFIPPSISNQYHILWLIFFGKVVLSGKDFCRGCDNYRKVPKTTENLPKTKLPKTNPNSKP